MQEGREAHAVDGARVRLQRVESEGDQTTSTTPSFTASVVKVRQGGAAAPPATAAAVAARGSVSAFHSLTDQSAEAVSMAACVKGERRRRLTGPACAGSESRYCSA